MKRPILLFLIPAIFIIYLVSLWQIRYRSPEDILPDQSQTPVTLTAILTARTKESYELSHISFDAADAPSSFPYCLTLSMEESLPGNIPIGSIVTLSGTFSFYPKASNPGEFDAYSYYRSLGIYGKITDISSLRVSGKSGHPILFLKELLCKAREKLSKRLGRIFPPKEASIMEVLLLGQKKALDPEIKALYQSCGISHILSISGLHISVLGYGVFLLLKKLGCHRKASAAVSMTILYLYMLMTVQGVTPKRAVFMYSCSCLAIMLGRTKDSLISLFLAAFFLTLPNPMLLHHQGFLLSFGAMFGILLVHPALSHLFPPQKKQDKTESDTKCGLHKLCIQSLIRLLLNSLRSGLLASASITLSTLPITLYYFYEIPTYSILINLLVLPCMTFLLLIGFLALLLPGFGFLGTVSYWILKYFEWICRAFQKLPFSHITPGQPAILTILLYYLGLGVLLILLQSSRSSKRPGCSPVHILCLMLLLPLLLFSGNHFPDHTILFADVGQGDGILFRAGSSVYLSDFGSTSRSGVGQYVLLPILKYYGIHSLDGIFLSHPDADHMNGIMELLSCRDAWNIRIKALYIPALVMKEYPEEISDLVALCTDSALGPVVEIIPLKSGDIITSAKGDPSIYCLHPSYEASDFGNINSDSLCLLLHSAKTSNSILFTGDVERDGESAMARNLALLMRQLDIDEVDVLKAAHHGSSTSTGNLLLETAHPRLAIISAGKNNRYGHPHKETLERLDLYGVTVLQTKETGAVLLRY